jgi:predicted RNA-binding Zn ribbon-like protein
MNGRNVDSDDLALDFLNTRRYVKGRATDLISTPDRLLEWLDRVGFHTEGIDTELSPPAARLLFDEARRLRGGIRTAVEAHVLGEPMPPSSLYVLNRALDVSRVTTQLIHDGEKMTLLERDTAPASLAALSRIALTAARLLTDVDRRRIRQCRSDRCVLWFLDTSKSGRRRWCSMATCGNRAKAARHYQKQKTPDQELRSGLP